MTVTFLLFLKEIFGSLIGFSDFNLILLNIPFRSSLKIFFHLKTKLSLWRLCNQIFTIMIGIVYKRPLQSFYFFSFQVYYD